MGTSIFVRLVCVNKMFDDCTSGNWREIFTFFVTLFYILVAGIYVSKTVKKCLQFVYIFADLLPVNNELIAYRNQFFKKLSAQCLYGKIMPVWRSTPFLPNICLTRIQTFHMLFEPYCQYNSMEK
jgi:hypothetical protein